MRCAIELLQLVAGLNRSSLLDQESTRLRSSSLINSIRFACIFELVSIRLCSIASGSLNSIRLYISFNATHALDSMQRVLWIRFVGAEESDSIWDRIGICSSCDFFE